VGGADQVGDGGCGGVGDPVEPHAQVLGGVALAEIERGQAVVPL